MGRRTLGTQLFYTYEGLINHHEFFRCHQSGIFYHKGRKGSTKSTKLDVDGLCVLWC